MSSLPLRSMIAAPAGRLLIACDLSQAESWIVAFRANEVNMKHSLRYGDIHTETAGNALFFNTVTCSHVWSKQDDGKFFCPGCGNYVTKDKRYVGKRCNHALAYRMGPDRMAQVINADSDKSGVVVTVAQAKQYSAGWHKYYNIKAWWHDIEDQLRRTMTITTTYGRRRTFFAAWDQQLFKEATAFEPQSTVADHANGCIHPELGIPGGVREVYNKIVKPHKDIYLVNQAHDSVMLEVPQASAMDILKEVHAYMQRPLVINGEEFTIPADGEIGERWGQLEAVKTLPKPY